MERRGILLIKIEDKFCDDYYTIFNLLKNAFIIRIDRRLGMRNTHTYNTYFLALKKSIDQIQPDREDWEQFLKSREFENTINAHSMGRGKEVYTVRRYKHPKRKG